MNSIIKVNHIPKNELAYVYEDGELIMQFTEDGRYTVTKMLEDKERKARKMRDRRY